MPLFVTSVTDADINGFQQKAVKAVARRLAVIFYNIVKKKVKYDPKIVALDQKHLKARKMPVCKRSGKTRLYRQLLQLKIK